MKFMFCNCEIIKKMEGATGLFEIPQSLRFFCQARCSSLRMPIIFYRKGRKNLRKERKEEFRKLQSLRLYAFVLPLPHTSYLIPRTSSTAAPPFSA
jgi:hypothetical protein